MAPADIGEVFYCLPKRFLHRILGSNFIGLCEIAAGDAGGQSRRPEVYSELGADALI